MSTGEFSNTSSLAVPIPSSSSSSSLAATPVMGTPRSVAGTPRFGSGDIDPVQRLRAVFISSITDVFSSLPPRAATIETDAFSPLPRPPAKPTVELFFSKAYPSAPKVVCWLLLKPDGAATDPALVRVKASSVTVTAKSAVVNLPPEAASNPRAVLYWFAFTTQKTNPVLTATLQKIFSHPSSFPKSVCQKIPLPIAHFLPTGTRSPLSSKPMSKSAFGFVISTRVTTSDRHCSTRHLAAGTCSS